MMAGALATGWFSFPVFALFCFVLGCIMSIYMVAYDSLYPLLVTEGNYQKAYSIQSILDTVSMVMVPVAAFCLFRVTLLKKWLAEQPKHRLRICLDSK